MPVPGCWLLCPCLIVTECYGRPQAFLKRRHARVPASGTGSVLLDCSKGTADPDGEPGVFRFSWRCVSPNPSGCATGSGVPLALVENSPTQQFTLQASPAGVPYNITCIVTKGDRSAQVTGWLLAKSNPLPRVFLSGLPSAKVNPEARLVLQGNVTSVAPETLVTVWRQTLGPALNLADPSVRSKTLRARSCRASNANSAAKVKCALGARWRRSVDLDSRVRVAPPRRSLQRLCQARAWSSSLGRSLRARRTASRSTRKTRPAPRWPRWVSLQLLPPGAQGQAASAC